MRLFERAGRLFTARSPGPHDVTSVVFMRSAQAGPYGHMINCLSLRKGTRTITYATQKTQWISISIFKGKITTKLNLHMPAGPGIKPLTKAVRERKPLNLVRLHTFTEKKYTCK
jgi:hypothetical protein